MNKNDTAIHKDINIGAYVQYSVVHGEDKADNTKLKGEIEELSMDWNDVLVQDGLELDQVEDVADALIMSLANKAKVDIEYMSMLTGKDMRDIISELKGSIYQNPATWEKCYYKGWETAEEYLSGNLMRKLNAAWEADEEFPGYFEDNIEALQQAMPKQLTSKDIYVTLGSPWVPTDVIDSFINYLLGGRLYGSIGTRHDEATGTWEIPNKGLINYRFYVATQQTYGTRRIDAMNILERTLNMKSVVVTDEKPCKDTKSGYTRVINHDETALALEKQKLLVTTFQQWIWRDKRRKARLEAIYEERYSCVKRRKFDGSFLKFPGLSDQVELFPYQKDATARILFSPNTLLAHDVGSGKTFIMIAAGMELKRMGLSKKNLYVVPNNIVGQWRDIFLKMYPNAKVMTVEPKSFKPDKRQQVLKTISQGDFDGIIMAYSCFEMIPLSKQFHMDELIDTRDQLRKLTADFGKRTGRLTRKIDEINKKLAELTVKEKDSDDCVYFDELGITRMFVDEAHNFKNLPIDTKADHVLGISARGSKKCKDMLDKVHMIQRLNDGGGVVMATGTPITNSITDVFAMQLYLQSGELSMLDLQSFDSWLGMFAERATDFEIDVDTNSYRMATRFKRFHNLPELTGMLSYIADFHQLDPTADLPEFDGYSDSLIRKTSGLSNYLDKISKRADAIRNGRVRKSVDNMLKITTDGRKAALDLRLVDSRAGFSTSSKVYGCAANVYKLYAQSDSVKGTQLVFCDNSTPKKDFNMYDELKTLLVNMGIPEEEIAFVHDADTEARRKKLFGEINKGTLRVLIGSTLKLGMGVNVQDKLVAIHHLDVPWRPADMTQREGRILRQGNTNPKVYIFRYITEGSFDAYSWQLLETKQRFITDLLSGSLEERSGSDVEGTVLDYAEVKALAVGNPLVKQRVETANELNRLKCLRARFIENHINMERELLELPDKILKQEQLVNGCAADIEIYNQLKNSLDKEARKDIRVKLHQVILDNVLSLTERELLTYKGFRVILPANMTMEKPYIWLKNNCRYKVEIGDSEVGALVRVDNFLDGLEEEKAKYIDGLKLLEKRQQDLKLEVLKTENYGHRIKKCQDRLKDLDERLGVNKDE
ncbi:MAG: DEAD/DEAH box helicase family protein [Lachnospiraceae bacterium]|nr:DEAD/DEAH box helicase family protein [Lachnospiraceae bacterium]